MLQKIRIFLKYTLWWIVVIGCIWLIGSLLYPLLTEKYNSMALRRYENASGGISLQIPSGEKTQLDTIADGASQTVGTKISNFFALFKEILTNNQPKKEVIYQKDTVTGVYKS